MDTFSRFPIPDLDALPDDIRSRIVAVHAKAGFIPNVFLAWAHRPQEFRAFFAYHDALLEKPGGLTRAEREMIVVATSALNHCHYCVIAHGALLRIRARQPLLADQIAINYLNADLTARQRAILDFGVKVAERSHAVSESDFVPLHAEGLTDDDIWDIGAIAALFALSNRMANLMALRPNDEFYLMGRETVMKPPE
ncbi:MAG: peroxidase-related enzyme [Thermoanaerobaculia bacterium]